MPASTTDDFLILTVGDDNVDIEHSIDAAGPSMHDAARRLLVRRTQCVPLSAPIKQRLVWAAQHRSARGAHKRRLPAAGAVVAGPAERATELGRR